MICIYVAIGQKRSTVASLVETLTTGRRDGLHDRGGSYCLRSQSAAVHCALFRLCHGRIFHVSRAKHVLIIYDDLSKHAVAYRALSLLIRRPPGREAYPG